MKQIDKQIWELRLKMARQIIIILLLITSCFAVIPMFNAMNKNDWHQAIFWLLLIFAPHFLRQEQQ